MHMLCMCVNQYLIDREVVHRSYHLVHRPQVSHEVRVHKYGEHKVGGTSSVERVAELKEHFTTCVKSDAFAELSLYTMFVKTPPALPKSILAIVGFVVKDVVSWESGFGREARRSSIRDSCV